MKHVQRVLTAFLLGVLFLPIVVSPVIAAEIRQGDSINVSSETAELKNVYLFGDTIRIQAPVQNDVITAGGNITVESPVQQSVMAAGGNITIRNTVGNSIRAAGGNITIDGNVTNDLLITGGDITITKNARIGGDILFAGGTLKVEGPVGGRILFAGGDITLNNTVGKGVEGYVGQLRLGSNAVINGDLKYSSENKVQLAQGSSVQGKTTFDEKKKQPIENQKSILGGGILYKLAVDIILTLLLIYFLKRFVMVVNKDILLHPIKNGVIGFCFLFLFPIAAFMMFILLWLGAAAFFTYGLAFIFAIYLTKAFVGWWIMRWYTTRSDKKKHYELEWKAGVIGPIVLFVLNFIPVLGWLLEAIIFLIALGTLLLQMTALAKKAQ